MRVTKLVMLVGLAIAGVGGAAAADPCGPNVDVVQPEAAYDDAPAPTYEYAPPPRVIERDDWAARRWYRWRRERMREREIREREMREMRERADRDHYRTARSYRHGSRW
jgi:hypothetical protein